MIICPIHGMISQLPGTHLKSGCRLCADADLKGLYSKRYFDKNSYERNKPAMVYYVKFRCGTEVFYKVGITTTTVNARFGVVPKNKVKIEIISTVNTTLYKAWKMEASIQSSHGDDFRYIPKLNGVKPRKYRIGASECFSEPLPTDIQNQYFNN